MIRLLILTWVLASFGCVQPDANPVKEPFIKPNVILIITDDQGYGDLGAHGNPILKTPHMDSLHANSIRLTDFHVNPTCSPSRAALLTGRNANKTGAWHTIAGRSQLRADEVTMADVFTQNKYQTAIFGKWHLGDNFPFRPQDRGFQEVLIHGGGGVGQQPDFWGNDYLDDTYLHNGQARKFEGYCTDVWFDQAISFIEQQQGDQPFFCYISTNAPHSPFWIEDEYTSSYTGDSSIVSAPFYGMIENIDYNLGKLRNYLRRAELEHNTLLIFMSDNGTAGGARIDPESKKVVQGFNAGMRGTKNTPFEGGHRVPCFLYWPAAGIKGGIDVNTLSAHVDLMPTLIDLLGLESDNLNFDGMSLKDELFGNDSLEGTRTLITDSQRQETPQKWKASTTMRGKWRLINGRELYQVQQDPAQEHDIAADHPEVVAELRSDYEQWWSELQPYLGYQTKSILGDPRAPNTTLYVHDMHLDETYGSRLPWHQRHVRSGDVRAKGWWSVKVASAGKYRFTLYRWPPQENIAINEGIAAQAAVEGTSITGYHAGPALPITEAGLQIGGIQARAPVQDQSGISFEIDLVSGDFELQAWFAVGTQDPFAVNYIQVEKL